MTGDGMLRRLWGSSLIRWPLSSSWSMLLSRKPIAGSLARRRSKWLFPSVMVGTGAGTYAAGGEAGFGQARRGRQVRRGPGVHSRGHQRPCRWSGGGALPPLEKVSRVSRGYVFDHRTQERTFDEADVRVAGPWDAGRGPSPCPGPVHLQGHRGSEHYTEPTEVKDAKAYSSRR